jgi:hypothetical protein
MTSPLDRSSTPQPGFGSTAGGDPSLLEADADQSYSQSMLRQTAGAAAPQKQLLTSTDAAIMQREREISDIARGILELADIFKELQTMVIDQGTMLDRIDYNVERMAVDVKAADKELTVVRIRPLCFCVPSRGFLSPPPLSSLPLLSPRTEIMCSLTLPPSSSPPPPSCHPLFFFPSLLSLAFPPLSERRIAM